MPRQKGTNRNPRWESREGEGAVLVKRRIGMMPHDNPPSRARPMENAKDSRLDFRARPQLLYGCCEGLRQQREALGFAGEHAESTGASDRHGMTKNTPDEGWITAGRELHACGGTALAI
jgi:hypothetical protein